MFTQISAFEQTWSLESANTQKLMDVLTDASLKQEVTPEGRTLGRLAWHITTTIHDMLSRTGLVFEAPGAESAVPTSAKEIADGYRQGRTAILEAMRSQWTDANLGEMKDMFGQQWPVGLTLNIFISHEIHHRGQMTILMRQAGLVVPGVYGPAKEEWSAMGMEPPAV